MQPHWAGVMVALTLSAGAATGQSLASVRTNTAPTAAPLVKAPTLTAEELAHKKYQRETMARLAALEMNDDAASLAAILVEMKNPDPKIRSAALQATVQFNDRSAIPALQKIADETQDAFEKTDILKAIEYMKLPSLTELMTRNHSAGAVHSPSNAPPIIAVPPSAAGHP